MNPRIVSDAARLCQSLEAGPRRPPQSETAPSRASYTGVRDILSKHGKSPKDKAPKSRAPTRRSRDYGGGQGHATQIETSQGSA